MDTHDHTHDEKNTHPEDYSNHSGKLKAELWDAIPFLHGHHYGDVHADTVLESSERGIWALKVSLAVLAITALAQLVIVYLSGSVGLMADSIHNLSDGVTAIPLAIAFVLSRRLATRRFTYGYGRAEDIAGVIIVLLIFASALVAAYESYQKLIHPTPLGHATRVMAAAVIGFVGNEFVAIIRMKTGREIGSAALEADGRHAQIDGFTSLAVFFGALGSLLGFPISDPVIGLVITLAILVIVKDTAVTIFQRLMDAVDPELVEGLKYTASRVPGVEAVNGIRVRWIGHRLFSELNVAVSEALPTRESHRIGEEVRHILFHAYPKLVEVMVHIEPSGPDSGNPHALTAHHPQSGAYEPDQKI
jgi:cation diffusion facilitator family transporter